jgi:hypothetical protein
MSDNLAEQIARDLIAQNMLDVPTVIAAKVIASTIARAESDAKCMHCQTPIEDGNVCIECVFPTIPSPGSMPAGFQEHDRQVAKQARADALRDAADRCFEVSKGIFENLDSAQFEAHHGALVCEQAIRNLALSILMNE